METLAPLYFLDSDSLPQLVGFGNALHRAFYLFGILADYPHFDIDKDDYEGTLMLIDDTTKNTEATIYVDKPTTNEMFFSLGI